MDKKDENSPSNLWNRRSKYAEHHEASINAPANTDRVPWRTNSSKTLSLSMNKSSSDRSDAHDSSTPSAKRFGSISSKSNPFNSISSNSVASPTSASGSASFGLGSGAFASFGSANKTPKTPGTAFDWGKSSSTDKKDAADEKDSSARRPPARKSISSLRTNTTSDAATAGQSSSSPKDLTQPWTLKNTWVIHYRPPTGKNSDYEKSMRPLCRIDTAQAFWQVYSHLKRPSSLPAVSDYHFFKEGIRPVWEDEENKRGGKWTVRLKKGVVDRYWEDLLLALIGDQFAEASDEVCGAVVSVRSGEDVFSIWTKNDGGRNVKIRETVKRVLGFPGDTNLVWRSHDDTIQSRTVAEATKGQGQGYAGEKRRNTLTARNASVGEGQQEA